jgi:hypothetical protein
VYPPHQTSLQLEDQAEQYFQRNFQRIQTDLIYCPIKWTAYHINGNYGTDEKELRLLQNYVKTLPKNQKYFTIVQYDDGLLVDFPNCVVFSAGGKPDNAIPIPLVSDRHNVTIPTKKYLASFMGNPKTHPIREMMIECLKNEPDIYIGSGSVKEFEDVTAQSYFSLCPRGYGKTSFRMYEAMEMCSVPVYISDEHWVPFYNKLDWSKFSLLEMATEFDIKRLPNMMRILVNDGAWNEMAAMAKIVYNTCFEYNKLFEVLKGILESDYNNKRKA